MGEIIVLEEKLRNQRIQNKIRRNIFKYLVLSLCLSAVILLIELEE